MRPQKRQGYSLGTWTHSFAVNAIAGLLSCGQVLVSFEPFAASSVVVGIRSLNFAGKLFLGHLAMVQALDTRAVGDHHGSFSSWVIEGFHVEGLDEDLEQGLP